MISFDAIINSLEEAVILFDRSSRIVYLNKTAEELFRRSSRDILGKKLTEISAGGKAMTQLIRKTLSEGRSFRGRSVSMDIGHLINADFSLSPFFTDGATEGALLSISENIAIGGGADYDTDSMVFVIGSIAHEIKNPLGGIKGAAQLLRDKPGDTAPDEYIDLIIRETDRLNAILSDYLTVCRKPSFNRVNIHEVVEKALSVMQVPLEKAGIGLKRNYDPSLPQVRGDEGKLLQVFLNIVKNAAESMRKGGAIEISTYPSDESVREGGKTRRLAVVSLADTGKGMTETEAEKIFIPFYTRKKGGTGIGLALSKKIVKDHGGMIKVKSVKGKGTTLSVYIPFEQDG